MQNSAMFWVALTTLILVSVTVMVSMNLPFNLIFFGSVIGQVFVVIMVYNVLTDNYKTAKTFEDFYEDNPIGNRTN
ncbi:hypothetical protein [Maribacter sp. 2307UL18-2]|uniref:hypothetical protein n=1 Tax=Maribacter sp. 2307UL18-2 TaxID=3386274 RepID=UPI0039BCB12E